MLRVTSVRFRGVVTIVRRAVENMLQVLRFQGCDMHSHYKGIRPKDVMCICGQIGVGAGGGGKGGAQICDTWNVCMVSFTGFVTHFSLKLIVT